jgi:hypothetical protein
VSSRHERAPVGCGRWVSCLPLNVSGPYGPRYGCLAAIHIALVTLVTGSRHAAGTPTGWRPGVSDTGRHPVLYCSDVVDQSSLCMRWKKVFPSRPVLLVGFE